MTVTDEMLKRAAEVFCENGFHISLPSEGDLDDVERERYETLKAALTAALSDQPNPAAQFVMWAMLSGSWQGDDIDGGAAQDKAVELGLIVETKFDPIIHGESGHCEPGDTWYVPSEKLLAMLPAPPPSSPAGEG